MIDWALAGLCLFSGMLIVYHHAAYPILLRWYARHHPARQIEESHRCYKDEQQDCTLPTIHPCSLRLTKNNGLPIRFVTLRG